MGRKRQGEAARAYMQETSARNGAKGSLKAAAIARAKRLPTSLPSVKFEMPPED